MLASPASHCGARAEPQLPSPQAAAPEFLRPLLPPAGPFPREGLSDFRALTGKARGFSSRPNRALWAASEV